MTPRERRDLPWVMTIGGVLILVLLGAGLFYGGASTKAQPANQHSSGSTK